MKEWEEKEERELLAMDVDKAAYMCLENIEESYTYEDLLNAFKGGAGWQREKVLSLIESRLSQIMGDAQPRPILRAELYDLYEWVSNPEAKKEERNEMAND